MTRPIVGDTPSGVVARRTLSVECGLLWVSDPPPLAQEPVQKILRSTYIRAGRERRRLASFVKVFSKDVRFVEQIIEVFKVFSQDQHRSL